jgi:hypothetical protein
VKFEGENLKNNKIFISYSHKDEERKCRLEDYLAPLGYQGLISVWSDREIEPGEEWLTVLGQAVADARLALLLVSVNFLASEFIMTKELPWLLGRKSEGQLQIVPIILETCPWSLVESLRCLQALPTDGRPIFDGNESQTRSALTEIAKELHAKLEKLSRGHNTRSVEKDHELALTSESVNHKKGGVVRSTAADRDVAGLPRRRRDVFPPRGWLATILGAFEYWRASEVVSRRLEEHRRIDVRPRLSVVDSTLKNSNGFKEWRSRPVLGVTRCPVVIISGPVGVGKTTFLNQLIAVQAANVDMIVRLTGADLYALTEGQVRGDRVLWGRIRDAFRSSGPRRLTGRAIAYALSRRRVLLVVEDLHLAGKASKALMNLRGYFERNHRPGHPRILVTTRESQSEESSRDTEIIRLEPLRENEPGEFFWAVCVDNQIPLDPSGIGKALSEAFRFPTTRTPLFVLICAWLVVNFDEYRSNVEKLLQMDRARIFGLFIKELFARSLGEAVAAGVGAPLRGFEPFLKTYEQVALAFWPDTRKIDVDQLDRLLKGMGSEDERLTTEALIENGFLYQPRDVDRGLVSFPHQALADYLAAKVMLDARDFHPLRQKVYASTSLEGFVGFLAELIGTRERTVAEESLLVLARDELSAFVEVAKARTELLRERGPAWYERLIKESARWATADTARHQSPATWVDFRELLSGLWSPWLDHFCTSLGAAGASYPAVEALATMYPAVESLPTIGERKAHELLNRWLSTSSGTKRWRDGREYEAFRNADSSPNVRGFLIKAIQADGLGTARGWNAFRIAWSSADATLHQAARQSLSNHLTVIGPADMDIERNRAVLKMAWDTKHGPLFDDAWRWIENHATSLGAETLNWVIGLDNRLSISALAEGCRSASIDQKRRISHAVAQRLDLALIPPGEYLVKFDSFSRICRVNDPLLVPCKPRLITGVFSSPIEAMEAVRKQTPLTLKNFMNEFQARVAIQYFADRRPSDGMLHRGVEFPAAKAGHREVIANQKKTLELFAISDPNKTSIQVHSSDLESKTTLITTVAFRVVEWLPTRGIAGASPKRS